MEIIVAKKKKKITAWLFDKTTVWLMIDEITALIVTEMEEDLDAAVRTIREASEDVQAAAVSTFLSR